MKNAMKKFFSIALALVLLVSALPFSAAAAAETIELSKLQIRVANGGSLVEEMNYPVTSGVTVKRVLKDAVPGWSDTYEVYSIKMSGVDMAITDQITEGGKLAIVLKEREPKETQKPTEAPEETQKPTEAPEETQKPTETPKEEDKLTDYTKFAYPVYLNIYTDTTVGTVKKTVNITEGIAKDGVVTLAEVKSVVEYYYNSVDTDKGIQYDGLYPAQGNWVHNYVHDQKYERIEGLYEAAAQNYVYINVMITNATAGSTSTADSTNPKTGDAIFAPMAVMAVSASALALFFFYNKKRAI